MSRPAKSKPITRDELVSIVEPLFQESKAETRQWGVLTEQMNNKIDTALEISTLVTNRLDWVETDLHVLKISLGRSKK
jgi:hypothetical protein